MIGAGAKVLGNITVGEGAKVGAGAWCCRTSSRTHRRRSSGPAGHLPGARPSALDLEDLEGNLS
jgi:hypothetical protein